VQATVKWFDDSMGYGYVTLDDGRDAFVHWTAIQVEGFKTLSPGQRITLDLYESSKGNCTKLEARNVKPLDGG